MVVYNCYTIIPTLYGKKQLFHTTNQIHSQFSSIFWGPSFIQIEKSRHTQDLLSWEGQGSVALLHVGMDIPVT